jgi:hypothetical protein
MFRLPHFMLAAILLLCNQAQSAGLWFSGGDILRQADTTYNQVILSLSTQSLGKVQTLAVSDGDGVWALSDKHLLKLDAGGAILLDLNPQSLGVEGAATLLPNPYDLSLWLVSGKTLLHLNAAGQLLGKTTLPGVTRTAVPGLDEHLWLLGNKTIWRYSPQGRLLAAYDLRALVREEPKFLAVDSMGGKLWLAGEKQLVLLDLNAPSQRLLDLPLPKPVRGLALNERTGALWLLTEDSLSVYGRNGLLTIAINPGSWGIADARIIAFDPFSQSLWLGHKNGLARFSAAGVLEATLASGQAIEAIGVTPLMLTPKLALISPLANAITNNPRPTITLGLDTLCLGLPCGFAPDYLASYSLNAQLDGGQVGKLFQLAQNTAVTAYAPATNLAEGSHTLSAQIVDRFGHSSNTVNTTFTVDTIPPRFLSISPADGSIFTEPQIFLSGTVDDAQASVMLSSPSYFANQTGSNFNFPFTLAPGLNSLKLSATDAAINTTSLDLRLSYIPETRVSVNISEPATGASIAGDSVLVSGTFQGPHNTGITVNGVVALQDGTRYYASVPLIPGVNTLTVTATTPDGLTATQTVTVTSGGSSPISVSVQSASGIAPLKTAFTVQNNTANPLIKIQIDFDGNGTVDFTTTNPGAKIETTYVTPGVYQARVTAADSLNNVFIASPIVVVQNLAKLDAMLRGIYTTMLLRLKQGNIDAALTSVTGGVYEKYKAVFTALKPSLATTVDQLGEIQDGTISSNMAEYIVVRNTATGPQAFLIYFILSEDGIWRIDGM